MGTMISVWALRTFPAASEDDLQIFVRRTPDIGSVLLLRFLWKISKLGGFRQREKMFRPCAAIQIYIAPETGVSDPP